MSLDYRCNECGRIFDKFRTITDKCGMDTPPYRKLDVCPYCGEFDDISARTLTCDVCGKGIYRGDIYFRYHGTEENICADHISQKEA